MKRNLLWLAGILISTFFVWGSNVGTAMAANPSEVVVFSCIENIPGNGYSVVNYDHSSGAPGQPSGSCSAVLETLLGDGLINVNVTVQTYIYTDTTTGVNRPGFPGGPIT